jgi:alpha-L-arabinofuranosidase
VRGAVLRSGTSTTLVAHDVHDHNTFAKPDVVVPTKARVAVSGPSFVYRFPAASVTKLEMPLGT